MNKVENGREGCLWGVQETPRPGGDFWKYPESIKRGAGGSGGGGRIRRGRANPWGRSSTPSRSRTGRWRSTTAFWGACGMEGGLGGVAVSEAQCMPPGQAQQVFPCEAKPTHIMCNAPAHKRTWPSLQAMFVPAHASARTQQCVGLHANTCMCALAFPHACSPAVAVGRAALRCGHSSPG